MTSTTRAALVLLVLIGIGWLARCHRLDQIQRATPDTSLSTSGKG